VKSSTSSRLGGAAQVPVDHDVEQSSNAHREVRNLEDPPQLTTRAARAKRAPPHKVGNVQDLAISVFGYTFGTSNKIARAIPKSPMRQLREMPATAGTMTQLAALESEAASAPGSATPQDRVAASVGLARIGAAHIAASTAALGARGLEGVFAAGYLHDLLEELTAPHR